VTTTTEARAYEQTRELLSSVLRARLNPNPGNDGPWGPYIVQTYDDQVVYEWQGKYWQVSYSVDVTDGVSTVTFGDPVEVAVTYSPVTESVVIGGEYVALQEQALRPDGTALLKIIQPGWGSSGYYSEQLLRRDGPKVFKAGLKSYWNHPTASEAAERPERDLRDFAAELVSDARYLKNGPAGPGLYADAKVFEAFAPAVEELAPHIGVSIRAQGVVKDGEAEGRKGKIVEKLSNALSVDFVTEPGAGGRVVQLFESAGRGAVITEDSDVDETRVQELIREALEPVQNALTEARSELEAAQTENSRLREALIVREARDLVAAQLASSQLPELTRGRLLQRLTADPPVREGALDAEALTAAVTTAIAEEAEYLSQVAGSPVRGMGTHVPYDDQKEEAARIARYQRLGLSESAAKVAAAGRA
jgi:hypothetical protein